MKFNLFQMVAVASLIATPAIAHEDEGSFTGLKAGALAGFDNLRLSDGESKMKRSGLTYGATINYDFDLGLAVIGAEGEISGSTISKTQSGIWKASDSLKTSIGRDLYFGARAGAKLSATSLLYAKAGFVRTRINSRYKDGLDIDSDGITMKGLRLGAGIEHNFDRFALRGEYRYTKYKKFDYGFDDDVRVRRHQVVVSFISRF